MERLLIGLALAVVSVVLVAWLAVWLATALQGVGGSLGT